MTEQFLAAKNLIEKSRNIALSTHHDPDLDGLGSLLALNRILKNSGKRTLAFSTGPAETMTDSLKKILPSHNLVSDLDPAEIDLVIGLDYGSPERLEILNAYPGLRADFLTFDHHAVGRHLGLKIIDQEISSTSELIYNFILFLQAPLDQETALCLLAGIMDDTSYLRHPSASAQTLRIAGELMLRGASLQRISRVNSHANAEEKLAALTNIFDKIQVRQETKLVFIVIDHKLFSRFSAGFNEAGLAGILSAAPEARLAATLIEKQPGRLDVSLRSQKDRGVDVAHLAAGFGGGGHRLAAGFRSTWPAEKIIAQIESLLLSDF